MIDLHHNALSTCSQKVRLVLDHKSISFTSHEIDLIGGGQHDAEYVKLNPKHVVPTLVHDGRVLVESSLIIQYLDDAFPNPPMRPADALGRHATARWILRADTTIHPAAPIITFAGGPRNILLSQPEDVREAHIAAMPDPRAREIRRSVIEHGVEAPEYAGALRVFLDALDDMEAELAETPWLSGEAFGLADATLLPYVLRLEHLGMDPVLSEAARPRVASWLSKVKALACHASAVEAWAPPAIVEMMRTQGKELWADIEPLTRRDPGARPERPMTRRTPLVALLLTLALGATASAESDLARCLAAQDLPGVARVVGSDGTPRHVRVLETRNGVPSRVAPIETGDGHLRGILARAAAVPANAPSFAISDPAAQVCTPFTISQAELDAGERVVVAAGLNYAAHAEEAGGGDTFLFPKPVQPTPPYGAIVPPSGVALLDYEVELGLVLLDDVDLRDLPDEQALLEITAFFVANDVTDREPIITHATLSGKSDGFVEAKGQPGFLPAGPMLVHGPALGRALFECGAEGMGLRLEVDEGSGFVVRQDADTELMLEEPLALIERIAQHVEAFGLDSPMPVDRDGVTRLYPLAVDADAPHLPAGSVILTGTPEGVALDTPDPLGLVWRGARHLRGPFEQYRQEQLARVAADEPGGFLAAGDRVRASIDGLGAQTLRVAASGEPNPDPCGGREPERTATSGEDE